MWKLKIIATLIFLVGLILAVTGMLGFVSVQMTQLGSVLIFISLGLRVISLVMKK